MLTTQHKQIHHQGTQRKSFPELVANIGTILPTCKVQCACACPKVFVCPVISRKIEANQVLSLKNLFTASEQENSYQTFASKATHISCHFVRHLLEAVCDISNKSISGLSAISLHQLI